MLSWKALCRATPRLWLTGSSSDASEGAVEGVVEVTAEAVADETWEGTAVASASVGRRGCPAYHKGGGGGGAGPLVGMALESGMGRLAA